MEDLLAQKCGGKTVMMVFRDGAKLEFDCIGKYYSDNK